MAVVLGCDAIASHSTAARLWGLPIPHDVPPIEVTTARPRRARLSGARIHRTTHFLGAEHTARSRIPVTSIARTLVDLSGRLSVNDLGRALDHACHERLPFQLRDLATCVAGLSPAPGRKPSRVRAVLHARLLGYDETESVLEMRVLRAIVGAGLPEPRRQHEVAANGRRYRLDLAYPEQKIGIEVDGWCAHGSRTAFDRDRVRENDLDVAGWHRLHFTSAFTDDDITRTVGTKLATVASRDVA